MVAFQLSQKSWLVRLYVWSCGIWNSFWFGGARRIDSEVDLCTMLRVIGAIVLLCVVCLLLVGYPVYLTATYTLKVAAQPGFLLTLGKLTLLLVGIAVGIALLILGMAFIGWLVEEIPDWISDLHYEREAHRTPNEHPSAMELLSQSIKNRFCPKVAFEESVSAGARYFPRMRTWVAGLVVILLAWLWVFGANKIRASEAVVWSDTCSVNGAFSIDPDKTETMLIPVNCAEHGAQKLSSSSMALVLAAFQKSALACTMSESGSLDCGAKK